VTTETLQRAPTLSMAGLAAIDCDVHPRLPMQADLAPFVEPYWREMFEYRNVNRLELMSYPVSTLPYKRPGYDGAANNVESLAQNLLDPLGLSAGILNVVSGVHGAYDPYMAAVLCQATNRWIASEWLDKDSRLRASLVVPFVHPEAAIKEIERYKDDKRFVQVIALVMGDRPMGQRYYWPIYEAMVKHGFVLGIHPGSSYRHAPTQCGYPSYRVEEMVHHPQAFANQVASMVAEGVFGKYSELKVVLMESGVSWLPGLMWRMSKDWRGARVEVPWVEVPPAEIITKHFRMTTQPLDAPDDVEEVERIIEHLGSEDLLLYSSDFPHAHKGDLAAWPSQLPTRLASKIARENVLATYPRLEAQP
jgi:predicted TIM-barrel fold metal-dependent hydrolase